MESLRLEELNVSELAWNEGLTVLEAPLRNGWWVQQLSLFFVACRMIGFVADAGKFFWCVSSVTGAQYTAMSVMYCFYVTRHFLGGLAPATPLRGAFVMPATIRATAQDGCPGC